MKTLLLDCDGPLALFQERVEETIGPFDKTVWNFLDTLGRYEREKIEKFMRTFRWWEELKPRQSSLDAIESLKSEFDVCVVTSPWRDCLGWSKIRREWIERHYGITNVVITDQKWRVKGDYFIDDKFENVENWVHNNRGTGLLFTMDYNRDQELVHPEIDRVTTICDASLVELHIQEKLRGWK